MVDDLENRLLKIISQSNWHMQVLKAVQKLDLPDCWVGAGFVRNYVWDVLHGYAQPTPLDDIDVVYYDPSDISKNIEKYWDQKLSDIMPGKPWSVKNQARMAVDYGDADYQNTKDGLKHWTEVATAIGMRHTDHNGCEILAPFGLEDLFSLKVRPTEHARTRPDIYNKRLSKKSWQDKWPKLDIQLI